MTPRERVRESVRSQGLDLVGIARVEPPPELHRAALERWLERGLAAGMAYMARRRQIRADPRRLVPWARSALVVAQRYRHRAPEPAGAGPKGRVSCYAWGDDYHDVLRARLNAVGEALRAVLGPELKTRAFVDTGPVLERALAQAAGLGWIGKNTLLIHPRLGSYIFLGVLFISLELEPDEPAADHCGRCRACIDACPTQAIRPGRAIDSASCISYLTIEHRGPFDAAQAARLGEWVYGCDVCQEVCPYNDGAPLGDEPAFAPRPGLAWPGLAWLRGLTRAEYTAAFRGSAIKRAKLEGLRRNAEAARGRGIDAPPLAPGPAEG